MTRTTAAIVLVTCGTYAAFLTGPPEPPIPAGVATRAWDSGLPVAEHSVKFAVIGDSGTGGTAQHEVAQRMDEARTRFPFAFVLMLGDNLYGSEEPAAYVAKFERPYEPLLGAGVTFHAALGNHDEPSQRFYAPFNMNGQRYYTFSRGPVDFFMLDSTYMTPDQLDWLRAALQRSTAEWKIACMHHPIYSSGEKHGSELDLQILVEPLFVEFGVDAVFAGHEHFYERLQPQHDIHYITQGGSAKLRTGNISHGSALTAAGFDADRSFTLVEIVGDQMFVETISRRGTIVDAAVFARREVRATTGQGPHDSTRNSELGTGN